MLATFSFAIFAGLTHLFLELKLEFTYINRQFLPDMWESWIIGILIPVGVMYVWYWLASWNEKTEKLVLH